MSSARRLQEDYRRILGITEDVRGLDDSLPRMRIEGQRGIFQIDSGETKSGSAGGEDEDGNPKNPITPDENQDNQNSDGSGQGGTNTDSSATDGSEFEIDPDAPTGAPVDDDTFGSDWASGGPSRFVDCETEQCIELVEVGGYVPPEGWDDADSPPPDEGEAPPGSYWSVQDTSFNDNGHSPISALRAYASRLGQFVNVTNVQITNKVSSSQYYGFITYTAGSSTINDFRFINLRSCSNSFASPFCDAGYAPPREEFWPSDNCIQLAPNAQGNWQASTRENPNDMTAKYSEAKSVLNLCNSAGESIEVYPRRGGGYVYFNADQGVWAASDSTGRKRSFGSSSTLNQEIARG